MSDTRNAVIAWLSSSSWLLAAIERPSWFNVMTAVVMPAALFAAGKTVDIIFQLYLRRRDETRFIEGGDGSPEFRQMDPNSGRHVDMGRTTPHASFPQARKADLGRCGQADDLDAAAPRQKRSGDDPLHGMEDSSRPKAPGHRGLLQPAARQPLFAENSTDADGEGSDGC